jgi:hypothetical protein
VVLNVVLEQVPPNTTFSRISSGFLTIKGPALTTDWHYSQKNTRYPGIATQWTFQDTEEMDWQGTPDVCSQVTLLMLFRSMQSYYAHYPQVCGLILVKEKPNLHRRVGLFHAPEIELLQKVFKNSALPHQGFQEETFIII